MNVNEQTLRKLAPAAGITAAGAAVAVAISKWGKDIDSAVSEPGKRDGSSGRTGSGPGSANRHASAGQRLTSSELEKRQKARAERRKQRTRKLKT